MRASTYRPREFVVELPDDGGISLDAIVAIARGGGTTGWLGEWLLYFSDGTTAVHARLAFGHLRLTADRHFIVPDIERSILESWCSLNARWAQPAWIHLEVVEPWSPRACRDWAAAYFSVLGERPRVRSLGHWPNRFPK